MMKKLQDKKGFTLVELMIVVVIMGILVAVAVPVYNSVTKNVKQKTCKENMAIIEETLDAFLLSKADGDVTVAQVQKIFPAVKNVTNDPAGGAAPTSFTNAVTLAKLAENEDFKASFKKGLPGCSFGSATPGAEYKIEFYKDANGNINYLIGCTNADHIHAAFGKTAKNEAVLNIAGQEAVTDPA